MANYVEGTQVLTSEQEVPCAWHQPGVDPKGSHGMCIPCAEKEFNAFREKKEKRFQQAVEEFNRVPSYVERFRKR